MTNLERIVKTLVLALTVVWTAALPGLALAQSNENPNRDVTCRAVPMANSMVCYAQPKWSDSTKALAPSEPQTFAEELRVRAREMSEIYVRKGQCDKAKKRSLATGDAAFVEEIERRCAPDSTSHVGPQCQG